jgi:hypothetical protein
VARHHKRRKHPEWLVVDGCPVPYHLAAQVYVVTRRAHQTVTSAYRGENPHAKRILHAHGKHTQAEIHADPQYRNISNPAGYSQHELKSDGPQNNRGIARGRDIPYWMLGIDSGANDQASKDHITHAAHHFGFHVVHPYSSGVEGHHWRFDAEPKPRNRRQKVYFALVRRRLPRR